METTNKQSKSCCLLKFSNILTKNEKCFEKFKLNLFICVGLFLVATIMFMFLGFNLSTELADKQVITIDYKSTVSESDYDAYQTKVMEIVKAEGFTQVEFDKSGEVTLTKLLIKIVPNCNGSELTQKLSNIKSEIETEYSSISALTVSDAVLEKSYLNTQITTPLILLGIFTLALFIYIWIRFEIVTAFGFVFQILFNILTLFSIMIIARIPFTGAFSTMFYTLIFVSAIIYLLIADKIRANEVTELKLTNSQVIVESTKTIMPTILICLSIAIIVSFVYMIFLFFTASSVAFTMLALLVALLLSFYSGVYFAPSFWVEFYKKERDKRLKAKIDRLNKQVEEEKNKSTKKENKEIEDEGKIVV